MIGVVHNVRQRTTETGAFDPVVYVPIAANPVARINVLVRFTADPLTVTARVRERVRAIDADLPLCEARTVDKDLARARWPQRVFGSLFAIFAAVALILAAVGLYAVTSYSTARRTQEIGLRMALGATASHVRWLVTRAATAQLAAGLLIGSAGAAAVARVIPAMLAGAGSTDLLTLATIATILLAIGLAAALIPARRATRLDPMSRCALNRFRRRPPVRARSRTVGNRKVVLMARASRVNRSRRWMSAAGMQRPRSGHLARHW